MNIQTTMSGLRKAAIVALMIGEDASASIFKHLSEDEIETLLSEMAALGRISSKMGEQVLEEFHGMWLAAEYLTRGGVEYAQKLLVKSVGAELARRILDRVVKSFNSTRAFTSLEKADPQQLSKFILSEHPQTIALVLAHVKPQQAAQLLNSLPDELRVEVLTRMASLDEISPEDWRRCIDVCLTGQFLCARRAVPLLKAAGGGAIVAMSSAAGRFGYAYRTPYSAAKWGVIGFTQSLAKEVGPAGIRVNAILPGIIEGPRMESVIGNRAAQSHPAVLCRTVGHLRQTRGQHRAECGLLRRPEVAQDPLACGVDCCFHRCAGRRGQCHQEAWRMVDGSNGIVDCRVYHRECPRGVRWIRRVLPRRFERRLVPPQHWIDTRRFT